MTIPIRHPLQEEGGATGERRHVGSHAPGGGLGLLEERGRPLDRLQHVREVAVPVADSERDGVERVDALVVVDAPLPQLPGHAQGAPGVEQDGAGRRDRPRRVVGLRRGEAHEGTDEVGEADAERVGDLLCPRLVLGGDADEEPLGIPFHVAHAPSFSTAAGAAGP